MSGGPGTRAFYRRACAFYGITEAETPEPDQPAGAGRAGQEQVFV